MSIGPAPSRQLVPWIVVSGWLLGVCIAFWHYEFRPQRSFAAPGFDAYDNSHRAAAQRWYAALAGAAAENAPGSRLTVVHVYRESCDCNRFTDSHLAEIEGRFRGQGVRFMRVASGGAAARGMPGWVSSLPAAFVFGADNQMLYFGPYSDAAWCGRSGALVEKVIERALQGSPPLPPAKSPWGCFCDN